MKIAQVVANYYKVGPHEKRAIYSAAALLTDGLVERGHDVDLFGAANSETKARIRSNGTNALMDMGFSNEQRDLYLQAHLSEAFSHAEEYDIMHAHFSLLSSFYSRIVKTPTVQSIHSPISDTTRPLLKMYKQNNYISFSLAQRKQIPELNWVANIYHGVDKETFTYNAKPKDYLLYLGRITKDKGVHLAIEAAKATKLPLVIAGSSFMQEQYWRTSIEPHIDGSMIRYVGNADFYSKIEYLQNARALLFPTQVEEAFGLSMIEAMSCGTPVIGWRNGSVPEVIQDGESGYIVKSMGGMVRAIRALPKISRRQCRRRAEKLFSVEKMVSGYEKVYARIIDQHERRRR